MIKFVDLEIEGFGSIANYLYYHLAAPGMNVLNAKNGIGKTTIFSAWYWCLFGKTLKHKNSIKTWEDKRTKDYKGCRVQNMFIKNNIQYIVIRHEDYKAQSNGAKGGNRLVLLVNGKEKQDLRDKKDVQNEIIKILGFSSDLFKNSVIFGQKMKRIIEEDGPTKKKVFEEIFETEYLQKAKEEAEAEKAKIELELGEYSDKLSSKIDKRDSLLESRKTLVDVISNFNTNKKEGIRELKIKLRSLNKLISSNNIKLKEKDNIDKKIKDLEKKKIHYEIKFNDVQVYENKAFRLDFKITQLRAEYDSEKALQLQLMSLRSQTCILCKQLISKEIIERQKKEDKANIDISRQKSKNILKDIDNALREWKEANDFIINHKNIKVLIKDTQEKLVSLAQLKTKLKGIQDNVIGYEKEKGIIILKLSKAKKSKCSYNTDELDDKIKSTNIHIDNIIGRLKKLKKNHEIQDWLIKFPLSNSGIKAYIFNQMIQLVNKALITYASRINKVINFGMDLESGNKDFYITIEDKKNIRFYNDLSGGEQQLINICIAFAIHDVICLEKEVNVLVVDEAFENLDPSNVDIVADLIQQKSNGKSLHIITHHQGFVPTNANFITLHNKKGITYKR